MDKSHGSNPGFEGNWFNHLDGVLIIIIVAIDLYAGWKISIIV